MEEKGTALTQLLGQHRYQLDAKGRIALPARYRDVFTDGVYLTLGQDGCLYAYPATEWQRRSDELQSLPVSGREARDYARMWFGNADRAELDRQGRLVIPQGLRARVGLGKDVVVVGVGERLEIWAGPSWDLQNEQIEARYVSGALDVHAG